MKRRFSKRSSENQLTTAEVEMVLRRAAELSARRRGAGSLRTYSVSPEVLVQIAAAAGISDHDVRRALYDVFSEQTAERNSLARRLYGSSRLRVIREIGRPVEALRAHLEDLLRQEQGLNLRRKTEASSSWDGGDPLGTMRRAFDFSGHHSLLKARSMELRVEDAGYGRSEVNLTVDVANQRGEYISLGAILGATLALPLAIAGAYDWLYFFGVIPALIAPSFGFKLAYKKACADVRRTMDDLLDAAEEGPPTEELDEELRQQRPPPGQIRRLKPIPKFTLRPTDE